MAQIKRACIAKCVAFQSIFILILSGNTGAQHMHTTLKKVHKACHYSKEVVILDLTQNI